MAPQKIYPKKYQRINEKEVEILFSLAKVLHKFGDSSRHRYRKVYNIAKRKVNFRRNILGRKYNVKFHEQKNIWSII